MRDVIDQNKYAKLNAEKTKSQICRHRKARGLANKKENSGLIFNFRILRAKKLWRAVKVKAYETTIR